MTTINAQTERDGSALVTIDGEPPTKIKATSLEDARTQVVTLAHQRAIREGRTVQVNASEPDGTFQVLVHPDGRREQVPQRRSAFTEGRTPVAQVAAALSDSQPHPETDQDGFLRTVFPTAPPPSTPAARNGSYVTTRDAADDGATVAENRWVAAAKQAGLRQIDPPPAHRSAALGPAAAPQPKRRASTPPAQVPNRIGERPSFITAGRAIQPAEQGWQGALNKAGFRLPPGPDEQSYRDDVTAVAQHWPGLRTVAVANPKGSGNKTPTSICLAAQFALIGGAGVLAWDNNETRGSLPWRVDHASHEATILDLLPRVEALLSGGAQFSEVGHYVHHQTGDKFDALFSDQSVDGVHVVTAADVDAVYRVAARYYRLAIMDSGNSERADNWLAMIDKANRLVVPCTNVEDTAEAAARMLESLAQRDERSWMLAQEAVVIVSQRNPGRDPNMSRIVGQFEAMGHTVVTIPHDPGLVTGVIRHSQLRSSTQRAWLSAAAAVARGL